MLRRRISSAILVVFLVLALVCGAWFLRNPENHLYSSPSAGRTNSSYQQLFAPAGQLPVRATNLLAGIAMSRSTNQLEISFPHSASESLEYQPLEIHRASAGEPINIGQGSVRLAYVGSAYASPRTNFDWQVEVPGNFYSAGDLQRVSRERLRNLGAGFEQDFSFQGMFPAARFIFVYSNIASLKPLRFATYDARTQYAFNPSYGSSEGSNSFSFSQTVPLWHSAPVEVAVTVATGPEQIFSCPGAPGAEINYPGGLLKVLVISETEYSGSSTMDDGRTNTVRFRAAGPDPYYPEQRFSLLLYSWPPVGYQRGQIEFFAGDGKKLGMFTASWTPTLIHCRITGSPADLQEIRFRYFPFAHRLIFKVPELPGLPTENRRVQNLFDVHVPFIRFQNESEFLRGIAELVQMESSPLAVTFPNGFFPAVRTNVTVRQLFGEWVRHRSKQENVIVADPVKNRIEERPNALYRVMAAIRKFLRL